MRALSALGVLAAATAAWAQQTPAPPIPKASQSGQDQAVRIDITPDSKDTQDTTKAPPPPATKKDDAKSPTAKKPAPPAKKKEDPPGKIDGIAITRDKGGFLGLEVINNNFVLSFYDDKKKKIAPDVTRAGLRWPVNYQPGPERAVLNPKDNSLTSAKNVRPPLNFRVFISLYIEGSEEPSESYSVEFHQ